MITPAQMSAAKAGLANNPIPGLSGSPNPNYQPTSPEEDARLMQLAGNSTNEPLDKNSMNMSPVDFLNSFPKRLAQEQDSSEFENNLKNNLTEEGTAMGNDISKGASDIQKGGSKGGSFGTVLKGLFEAGPETAWDAARAAFEPVSSAIQASSDKIADNKSVQGVAMNPKVGTVLDTIKSKEQALNDWSQANPEQSKALQTILGLGTLAVGESEPVQDAMSNLTKETGNLINKGVDTVNKGVDLVKNKISPTESSSPVDITQTPEFKNSISETMPKPTPSEIKDAGEPSGKGISRTSPGPMGRTYITPDDTDVARHIDTMPYLQEGGKDWVNQNNAIHQGITDTWDGIKENLKQNPVDDNYQNFIDHIKKIEPEESIKNNDSDYNTFNRVKNIVIEKMGNFLRDRATESGDFGSNSSLGDYLDGRANIKQFIKNQLGDDVFNPENKAYAGVKSAVQNINKSIFNYVSDSIKNPGQMAEFNKFTDFLGNLKARGIDISDEGDAVGQLREKFGLKGEDAENSARAAWTKMQLNKMKNLYDSSWNLVENHASDFGKTRTGEFLGDNAIAHGAVKGLKYIGRSLVRKAVFHLIP